MAPTNYSSNCHGKSYATGNFNGDDCSNTKLWNHRSMAAFSRELSGLPRKLTHHFIRDIFEGPCQKKWIFKNISIHSKWSWRRTKLPSYKKIRGEVCQELGIRYPSDQLRGSYASDVTMEVFKEDAWTCGLNETAYIPSD